MAPIFVFATSLLSRRLLPLRKSKTTLTIDERGSKIARNNLFDSHLSPAIENSVSQDFFFYLRSLIVLTVRLPPISGAIFFLGIRAATSTLQLVSEYPYPYGSTLWRMNAQCSFILPQDYTPNSAETGFRMKITLENHATGGIDVRS